MKPLRPRQLVHRGWVDAAAFLLDEGLLGQAEARRRAVLLWQPGSVVQRIDRFLLLRLARPLHVEADRAPGGPLVAARHGAALLGSPLTDDEVESLAAPPGVAVLTRDGRAAVFPLAALPQEDPADWIDLAGWREVAVGSLALPPAPPGIAAPSPPSGIRELLGAKVPPPAPELARVVESLRAAGAGGSPHTGRTAGGRTLPSWLTALLRWTQGKRGEPGDSAAAAARRPPRWSGLRTWMAKLLVESRLAHLFGRAQARYIRSTLELFERGDLAEALRRAIPLGGDAEPAAPPAFGVPTARAELRIGLVRTAASSSIGLPDDVVAELRRLYRRAADQLEARGEIEQAAFVLAELLQAEEEAVALLERHGKLRLAAELAEGRGLAPGLVVRQWLVAGEVQRAVQVARRSGAFPAAVALLERKKSPLAAGLRLLWAESLAAAGDYLAAVRVAWPLGEARALALHWIEQGLAAGGAAQPALLALRAGSVPEAFAEVAREVRRLPPDDAILFAQTLAGLDATKEVRSLARLAARALADEVRCGRLGNDVFERLTRLSGDGAFKADLRGVSLAPKEPAGRRDRPREPWHLSAQLRGGREILDAAYLPGRRLLVALGEAGAALLTRDGRQVAHVTAPTHRLVVGDGGNRALLLGRRGEVWRISRLDLATLRADDWWATRLEAYADSYDGGLWFVAIDGAFLAIDCRSSPAEALWRIPDLAGRVLAVGRSDRWCSFLVHGELRQCWRLELPQLVLRARDDLVYEAPLPPLAAVSPEGRAALWVGSEPPTLLQASGGRELSRAQLAEDEGQPLLPVIAGDGAILPRQAADGIRLDWIGSGKPPWACGFLEGARRASVRCNGQTVTLADDLGRLLAFDLASGRRLVDLRL